MLDLAISQSQHLGKWLLSDNFKKTISIDRIWVNDILCHFKINRKRYFLPSSNFGI